MIGTASAILSALIFCALSAPPSPSPLPTPEAIPSEFEEPISTESFFEEFDFETPSPKESTVDTDLEFAFDAPLDSETAEAPPQVVPIPIRGKLFLEGARQFGSNRRWVQAGGGVNSILDWNTGLGLFYANAGYRYNGSFFLENDPTPIADEYTHSVVLREASWKRSFDAFSVSAGKIVVVWSKADLLIINDRINAIDETEILFAKPDEARLGQNLIKLDFYFGDDEFNLVFSPEPAFNRRASVGHPYALVSDIEIQDLVPDRSVEFAAHYNHIYPQGSLSLTAGRVNHRDAMIEPTYKSSGEMGPYEIVRKPYVFVQGATNFTLDPFLAKAELSYQFNRPQQKLSLDGVSFLGVERLDQLNALVGLDWTHPLYGTFVLESALNFSMTQSPLIPASQTLLIGGLGWMHTLFLEDLNVGVFTFFLGEINNVLFRCNADYRFLPSWSIEAQAVVAKSSQTHPLLKKIAQATRFDLTLKYHFDLSQLGKD